MTQDEAQQLASEIRRASGWSVLAVEGAEWANQEGDEYRISAMYVPSYRQEWVYDREQWGSLKALYDSALDQEHA